jgi:pilus assembly protein CpaB
MNVRKIVWLAFALVVLGFLGVSWLMLKPAKSEVEVSSSELEAESAVVAVVEPVANVEQKVWLLAAKRDLTARTFLTVDDFNWRKVSISQRDKMIAPLEKGTVDLRAQIGGLLTKSVDKGGLLTSFDILRPGQNGYLAALIAPGKRAFSIEVDQSDASFRLVSPGDRVDVIMSAYLNGSEGGSFEDMQTVRTRTLIVNSRVLAVDDKAADAQLPERVDESNPNSKAVITLEVDPSDAQLLSLAATIKARLSLSARSLDQIDEPVAIESNDLSSLISEVKLAGPSVGLVLMRGIGTEFVGQKKEKKEANEE